MRHIHFMHRLSVMIVALLLPGYAEAANELVMNFRAHASSESWTTPHSLMGGAWEGYQNTPTGASRNGTPYRRWLAVFDGVEDYVRMGSSALVDTDDGLTLQAWFTPHQLDGKRVIFSNTQGAGFTLRIEDGKLAGLVNISGDYYKVISRSTLQTSRHYTATFIVDFIGDGIEGDNGISGRTGVRLRLLLNGSHDGFEEFALSSSDRIVNSYLQPLVGAEPGANNQPSGWFYDGYIEAVTVRNYPIEYNDDRAPNEVFFTSGSPRDRTTHNGQPSFWDHSWEPTLDEKVSDYNRDDVSVWGLVPFANDGYVVQGVTHTCAGDQPCTEAVRAYLSMYWKATDDETGNNRSLIVELDPYDGYRVARCWQVTGVLETSHLGGIAYAEGSIYAASDDYIAKFDIPSPPPTTSELSNCGTLTPAAEWPVEVSSSLSYLHLGSYGYLLVGKFCTASTCTNRSNESIPPSAYLYRLTAGVLDTNPAAIARLPQKTQGAALHWSDSRSTWVLTASVSYGDNPSSIESYDWWDARCSSPTSCPSVSPFVSLSLPPGAEDLTVAFGQLWSASESGARHYQRRPNNPWTGFFPFIFSVAAE